MVKMFMLFRERTATPTCLSHARYPKRFSEDGWFWIYNSCRSDGEGILLGAHS
jgi:hypothetical protein